MESLMILLCNYSCTNTKKTSPNVMMFGYYSGEDYSASFNLDRDQRIHE